MLERSVRARALGRGEEVYDRKTQRCCAHVPCPRVWRRRARASELSSSSPEEEVLRTYEALVIVDARLDEGDVQKAVDKALAVVTDSGGSVANVDRWGVRRFAYEIDHRAEGYYFVTTFTAPEDTVDKLKRTLQISDEFIRGKVVRPG
jgi:small subunit ribosomal protein S6